MSIYIKHMHKRFANLNPMINKSDLIILTMKSEPIKRLKRNSKIVYELFEVINAEKVLWIPGEGKMKGTVFGWFNRLSNLSLYFHGPGSLFFHLGGTHTHT